MTSYQCFLYLFKMYWSPWSKALNSTYMHSQQMKQFTEFMFAMGPHFKYRIVLRGELSQSF